MVLQFLGTSASPAMPVPFCICKVCKIAYAKRGKNLRRRSSVIINNDLLIDIGPDIMTASFDFNTPLKNIRICLQTHAHEDHFDPEMIIARHPDYGTKVSGKLLLVASAKTLKMMDAIIKRRCSYGSIFDNKVQQSLNIQPISILPFKSHDFGKYKIIGYPANHDVDNNSLIYSIEYGGKLVFYATDTSVLSNEIWDDLIERKKAHDVFIMDHTYGIGYNSSDHLATKDFIKQVDKIRENKLLKDSGQIYATHISHEGIKEHNKMEAYANKRYYHMAYDGLKICLK